MLKVPAKWFKEFQIVSVDAHRSAAVAGAYERGEWVSGNTAMKHLLLNVLGLVES